MKIEKPIGRELAGRYRLVAEIGSGASSKVFLAKDTQEVRKVAVKLLLPHLLDDPGFTRSFRTESKAASELSHPNLLPVYDSGEEDGLVYIITEILLGGSLRGMINHADPLSLSQGLLVGLQMAEGLAYAHSLGWVHRDIKPENVLFGEDGRLRIGDFGVAQALVGVKASTEASSGHLFGTWRYSSPEQARGAPTDDKTDIYSLALTIIEAVTGEVPLLGGNEMATAALRHDHDIAQLDRLGALGHVLARAGRANSEERPSAAELIELFTEAAQEMPRPRRLPLVGTLDGVSYDTSTGITIPRLGRNGATASATPVKPPPPQSPSTRKNDSNRELTIPEVTTDDPVANGPADPTLDPEHPFPQAVEQHLGEGVLSSNSIPGEAQVSEALPEPEHRSGLPAGANGSPLTPAPLARRARGDVGDNVSSTMSLANPSRSGALDPPGDRGGSSFPAPQEVRSIDPPISDAGPPPADGFGAPTASPWAPAPQDLTKPQSEHDAAADQEIEIVTHEPTGSQPVVTEPVLDHTVVEASVLGEMELDGMEAYDPLIDDPIMDRLSKAEETLERAVENLDTPAPSQSETPRTFAPGPFGELPDPVTNPGGGDTAWPRPSDLSPGRASADSSVPGGPLPGAPIPGVKPSDPNDGDGTSTLALGGIRRPPVGTPRPLGGTRNQSPDSDLSSFLPPATGDEPSAGSSIGAPQINARHLDFPPPAAGDIRGNGVLSGNQIDPVNFPPPTAESVPKPRLDSGWPSPDGDRAGSNGFVRPDTAGSGTPDSGRRLLGPGIGGHERDNPASDGNGTAERQLGGLGDSARVSRVKALDEVEDNSGKGKNDNSGKGKKGRLLLAVVGVGLLALAGTYFAGLWGSNDKISSDGTASGDTADSSESEVVGPVVTNFVGQHQEAVATVAETNGWTLSIETEQRAGVPAGVVISQQPEAGSNLAPGGVLTITVADVAPILPVPELVGLTQAEAVASLEAAQLTVGGITHRHDPELPVGQVIEARVAGSAPAGEVAADMPIDLVVSAGPASLPLPDLTGMSREVAETTINNLGLVPQISEVASSSVSLGDVISTDPGPGTPVEAGQQINIQVSAGEPQVQVSD